MLRGKVAGSVVAASYLPPEMMYCVLPSLSPGEYLVYIRVGDNKVTIELNVVIVYESFSLDEISPQQ